MHRRRSGAVLALVVLLLSGPFGAASRHAAAELCASLVVVPLAEEFYVDVRDPFVDEGSGGIWVYKETNGVPGLQRGTDRWPVDTCDYLSCLPVEPPCSHPAGDAVVL